MSKQNIFKLIRREEVVLWAGAGLSLYAGYPAATKLTEALYGSLTEEEKSNTSDRLLLQDLAEDVFRIKGNNRNAMIDILSKVFNDVVPLSTKYHEKIASIPHFKTIITTNYDSLFENSYKEKGQIIVSPEEVPSISEKRTAILKIHGDLQVPDSVIITKSDYMKFFEENGKNVYWSVIEERLSTKSVVFLGYNVEDINIRFILSKIDKSCAQNRREYFLVAPNLSQAKINDLTNNKIQYIDSTAENFIEELITDIKENIREDFSNGLVSPDTFKDFLQYYNLSPELKSIDGSYVISSINSNSRVPARLTLDITNKDLVEEFNNLISGKNFEDVFIPSDSINQIKVDHLGVNLMDHKDNIVSISIKPSPSYETKVDIRFEDGNEVLDIPIKLYLSRVYTEVHVIFKSAIITAKIPRTKEEIVSADVKYKHHDFCYRVKEEIEFFELLQKISTGESIKVFHEKGSFEKSFQGIESFNQPATYYLRYFRQLNEIERKFNVRFSNIEIEKIPETVETVTEVYEIAMGGEECFFKEMVLANNLKLSELELFKTKEQPVSVEIPIESIEIHGVTINLGYKKIEVYDAYISNIDLALKDVNVFPVIKSKSNRCKISYLKAPTSLSQNSN